jgi:hypothetical protein
MYDNSLNKKYFHSFYKIDIFSSHILLFYNFSYTVSFEIKMVRLTFVLLFVVAVAFVVADEDEDNSCTELK